MWCVLQLRIIHNAFGGVYVLANLKAEASNNQKN